MHGHIFPKSSMTSNGKSEKTPFSGTVFLGPENANVVGMVLFPKKPLSEWSFNNKML